MTKIDIISGFLGAGKTTFMTEMMKKLLIGLMLIAPLMTVPVAAPVMATYGFTIFGPN